MMPQDSASPNGREHSASQTWDGTRKRLSCRAWEPHGNVTETLTQLLPNQAPMLEGRVWVGKRRLLIREAGNLGRWRAEVQRPSPTSRLERGLQGEAQGRGGDGSRGRGLRRSSGRLAGTRVSYAVMRSSLISWAHLVLASPGRVLSKSPRSHNPSSYELESKEVHRGDKPRLGRGRGECCSGHLWVRAGLCCVQGSAHAGTNPL